ncbi:Dps family protein [Ensifer adhaerens]|uniref:Dps family protein n=1 Tax=Ensifer adhaerens TaxID=106592 RepID=UPI000CF0B543|nr:DNA starvation/stationary phase protection protein [Ensifer adhaerens]
MKQTAAVLKPKVRDEEFDIGLTKAYRQQMATALSDILADTYKLVIKSHIYHWNVVGPLFKPLHELTEEHYNALFKATDIIAERIRALGHLAPAKLAEAKTFAPSAASVNHTTAAEMVSDLIADHEAAARRMRDAGTKADDNADLVTTDMLTERLDFHEKALWMLRAIVAA